MIFYSILVFANPGLALKSDNLNIESVKLSKKSQVEIYKKIDTNEAIIDTEILDNEREEHSVNVVTDNNNNSTKFKEAKRKDESRRYFCSVCNISKAYGSKTLHCHYCDICIDEFDHHCPFTGKCIGKYNIYPFWAFIILSLSYLIYLIVVIGLLFIKFVEEHNKKINTTIHN